MALSDDELAGISAHYEKKREGEKEDVMALLSHIDELTWENGLLRDALAPFAAFAEAIPEIPRGLDDELYTYGQAVFRLSDCGRAQFVLKD